MGDPSDHSIVWRIEDCLQRMLSSYQQLSALHAVALQALETQEEPAQDILSHLDSQAFDPATLGEEYKILKREWDDTDNIPEEDRTRMRSLGDEVETLSLTLQQSYETLATHAQSQAHTIQHELNDLKRMGGIVQKYRPGGDEDRTGFDSQA